MSCARQLMLRMHLIPCALCVLMHPRFTSLGTYRIQEQKRQGTETCGQGRKGMLMYHSVVCFETRAKFVCVQNQFNFNLIVIPPTKKQKNTKNSRAINNTKTENNKKQTNNTWVVVEPRSVDFFLMMTNPGK